MWPKDLVTSLMVQDFLIGDKLGKEIRTDKLPSCGSSEMNSKSNTVKRAFKPKICCALQPMPGSSCLTSANICYSMIKYWSICVQTSRLNSQKVATVKVRFQYPVTSHQWMAPFRPLGKKPPGVVALPRYTMAKTSAGVREKAMLYAPEGTMVSTPSVSRPSSA